MLEIEKVPELLQLVAPISAILGPSWRFCVDTKDWEDAAHVSWQYPNSDQYPIAVDFYEAAMQGACTVQMFDLDTSEVTPQMREKIDAVIVYCKSNNIPYGFQQT
jgi:hypothetical protein